MILVTFLCFRLKNIMHVTAQRVSQPDDGHRRRHVYVLEPLFVVLDHADRYAGGVRKLSLCDSLAFADSFQIHAITPFRHDTTSGVVRQPRVQAS